MAKLAGHFYSSITLIFIILCTLVKAQENKNSFKLDELINRHISSIQNSIDSLVVLISENNSLRIDTAKHVERLDVLPEKEKKAKTIKFRFEMLQKSLNNISNSLSKEKSPGKGCHQVLVGYYSCNCQPNPNGTIHCDLCPIYKTVCD